MIRKGHGKGEDKLIRLSKSLSFVLRHKKDAGLNKRPDGYMGLKEVLSCSDISQLNATVEDIMQVVSTSNKKGKKLFELAGKGEAMFIRAVLGHSVKIAQAVPDDEELMLPLAADQLDLPQQSVTGTYRVKRPFMPRAPGLVPVHRDTNSSLSSVEQGVPLDVGASFNPPSGKIARLQGSTHVGSFLQSSEPLPVPVSMHRLETASTQVPPVGQFLAAVGACSACGIMLVLEARFCHQCGIRLVGGVHESALKYSTSNASPGDETDVVFEGLTHGGIFFGSDDDIALKVCQALGNMVCKARVKQEDETSSSRSPQEPRIEYVGRKFVPVDGTFYIQGSLSDAFSDGRPLTTYIADLRSGVLDPLALPNPIRVIEWPDLGYVTLDHRRLFCLKEHFRATRAGEWTVADVYKFSDEVMGLVINRGIFSEFIWKFKRLSASLEPRARMFRADRC